MWLEFCVACAMALVVLFVPGFVALLGYCLPRRRLDWAVAGAPVYGVASSATIAILQPRFGISASFATIFMPMLVAAIVIGAIGLAASRICKRRRESETAAGQAARIGSPSGSSCMAIVTLYVLVGLVATTVYFVYNLDTAASFYQAFDNSHHLNSIRAFLESANYSSFNGNVYVESAGSVASPYLESTTSFYPSAWHCLVAMVVQVTGVPITVGINAVNTMCLAAVFPVSMFVFVRSVLGSKLRFLLIGAAVAMGFAGSVWDFVSWGPLYPMLCSYMLAPVTMACFVRLVSADASAGERVSAALLFLVGCIAIALAQPCGIFLMAVILGPLLVQRAYEVAGKPGNRLRGIAAAAACALAIAAFWLFCYELPIFSSVVSHNWEPMNGILGAGFAAFTFSTTKHPVQLVLTVFVAIGFVYSLRHRKYRWFAGAHVITFATYVLAAGTDGQLKHILGGFWYSDPHRLAANLAFTAVPLAVLGASFAYDWLLRRAGKGEHERREGEKPKTPKRAPVVIMAVCLLLVYCPTITVSASCSLVTAFGNYGTRIWNGNRATKENALSANERSFCEDSFEVVGDDAVVVNEPNDGSGFLYGVYGTNTLYRNFNLPDKEDEDPDSVVIREKLDEAASNDDVRQALQKYDARYLLVLDQGFQGEGRERYWSYFPEQWEGIEGVSDRTPGFTVLLSRGDMRLYSIDLD